MYPIGSNNPYPLPLYDPSHREVETEVAGYMPIGGQYGFIGNLDQLSEKEMVRVTAHELGHGMFSLNHIWLEYPELTEQSTEN